MKESFKCSLVMALTANCDGIASKCKFFQPIGLCTEFDNVVYVCDTQTSYIKILTTLNNTARFLQAVDALYSAFSVHEKHDEYSLCNLPLMTACVFWRRRMCHPSRTWSTAYHGLLMTLKESVAAKTVDSVKLVEWELERLQQNLHQYSFDHTNLLSCMILDVENLQSSVQSCAGLALMMIIRPRPAHHCNMLETLGARRKRD